jgi:glutamyl-tRNA synthetase
MERKEFADLLLPDVEHDWTYYEAKYPARKLESGAMVTRFAPSPTGFVHMGSLYASFAALQLAKETKGICYLRIEDTDQKRTVDNGVQGIIDDFKNLNIKFDEGMGFGGNYGPYLQSARKDIYQAYAKKLIEEDLAYPCFTTPEELNEIREYQRQKKLRIGMYKKYAKDRNLSMDDAINRIKDGKKYIICLKSPGNFDNKVILHDAIKGDIEMPENNIDEVIIKSDGLPTYHFAHAIDDHLMHTTHVTRGDEWVSSYPIHHQLFEVLGFKEPIYAHIAPLTIKEGDIVRKISKRKDKEAAISYYHKMGIPVEAIRLYLATIENFDFEEWYTNNPTKSIDDFKFEFNKMPIGGTFFDIEKLMSISRIYFSRLKNTTLYDMLLKYTKDYDNEFYQIINEKKDYTLNILNIERDIERPRKDIASLEDVKKEFWYMYSELFDKNTDEYFPIKACKEEIIINYLNNIYNEQDTPEEWFNKVKDFASQNGYTADKKAYKANPDNYIGMVADFCALLRIIICKKNMSPNIYYLIKYLGKDEVIKRTKKYYIK